MSPINFFPEKNVTKKVFFFLLIVVPLTGMTKVFQSKVIKEKVSSHEEPKVVRPSFKSFFCSISFDIFKEKYIPIFNMNSNRSQFDIHNH